MHSQMRLTFSRNDQSDPGSGKNVGVRILAYPVPFSKGVFIGSANEVEGLVELVGADGISERREIASVERIVNGARLDDFGLSLEEGKAMHCRLQEELTQFQVDQASKQDRKCNGCGRLRRVMIINLGRFILCSPFVACACPGSTFACAGRRQD